MAGVEAGRLKAEDGRLTTACAMRGLGIGWKGVSVGWLRGVVVRIDVKQVDWQSIRRM